MIFLPKYKYLFLPTKKSKTKIVKMSCKPTTTNSTKTISVCARK